jgi:hypothetical protein
VNDAGLGYLRLSNGYGGQLAFELGEPSGNMVAHLVEITPRGNVYAWWQPKPETVFASGRTA